MFKTILAIFDQNLKTIRMGYRIPLMKNAFLEEENTKNALIDFLKGTNRLSMGSQCERFETGFAETQETKHAVLFNSGGSANLAIIQSLLNLGRLKKGDKVAFSALTWSTNTMPIIQMGLIPVALDCELDTMNVSADKLKERLLDTEIQALFLTNVLGFVDDITSLMKTCEDNGILLFEDNCESLGTVCGGLKTGNFGLCSSFSFYVAHHMSTIEGGMVCTADEEVAEMLKIVRANGWDRNLNSAQQQKLRSKHNVTDFNAKYSFFDLGYNLRPTEITGFLGNHQLQFLDSTILTREKNYKEISKSIALNPDFHSLKDEHLDTVSTFAIPLICKSSELREHYIQKLEDAGIETRPLIAGNMQSQPFYSKYVDQVFSTPNTDLLHANGLYCGNYPELTKEDIDLLIVTLSER